jgi:ribosomal-protein-alanine N-acetyltransferase
VGAAAPTIYPEVVTASEQLRLRRPGPDDLEAYERLFQLDAVERWLRPSPLAAFTAADAREMLHADIGHWRELEYGPWALVETGGGRFVGRAGLHRTTVEGIPATELAWTTDPDFQGRGFATEAALAAIELGRAVGLHEVVAMALPDNAASRRVAEKIGMELDREVSHAGLTHVFYRLSLS